MKKNRETPRRDTVSESRLAERLRDCPVASIVRAYEEVGSTMDIARDMLHDVPERSILVCARRQHAGRGRRGNVWDSPEGGVYLTVGVTPGRAPAEFPQLALVAGLAAAEAAESLALRTALVKWPNDVLINDEKVCGVLTESIGPAVLVGVGMNLTIPGASLPEGAASLFESGIALCENWEAVALFCERLAAWYAVWSEGGFSPIRGALMPRLAYVGEAVKVHADGDADGVSGIVEGIDDAGRLGLRSEGGRRRFMESGQVYWLRRKDEGRE